MSHPDQREAWWVDIKAELSDPARRAAHKVVVDKRTQRFDASAATALLQRAVPKGSGFFLSSPPKLETLTSNLLRVQSMPTVLYAAPAAVSTYRAAGEVLASEPQRGRGDWILRDRLVISFSDLTQPPLRALCAGAVERHDTTEWSKSDDTDTTHRLVDLLRRTVEADHRQDLRWHNDRRHLHFRPTRDLTPRREGKGPSRRGRVVFGPYRSKRDPGKISFYRHAALGIRFRRLGGVWYGQLCVDYCFTRDGYAESAFADSLLAGIKRLDRHAAVAGWTQTWANYLRRHPSLFEGARGISFGELATFPVERGIEEKLWGPAPTDQPDNDAEGAAERSAVDASLAAVGLDTGDLLSLLEEDHAEPDGPSRVSAMTRRSHRRPAGRTRTAKPQKRGTQ